MKPNLNDTFISSKEPTDVLQKINDRKARQDQTARLSRSFDEILKEEYRSMELPLYARGNEKNGESIVHIRVMPPEPGSALQESFKAEGDDDFAPWILPLRVYQFYPDMPRVVDPGSKVLKLIGEYNYDDDMFRQFDAYVRNEGGDSLAHSKGEKKADFPEKIRVWANDWGLAWVHLLNPQEVMSGNETAEKKFPLYVFSKSMNASGPNTSILREIYDAARMRDVDGKPEYGSLYNVHDGRNISIKRTKQQGAQYARYEKAISTRPSDNSERLARVKEAFPEEWEKLFVHLERVVQIPSAERQMQILAGYIRWLDEKHHNGEHVPFWNAFCDKVGKPEHAITFNGSSETLSQNQFEEMEADQAVEADKANDTEVSFDQPEEPKAEAPAPDKPKAEAKPEAKPEPAREPAKVEKVQPAAASEQSLENYDLDEPGQAKEFLVKLDSMHTGGDNIEPYISMLSSAMLTIVQRVDATTPDEEQLMTRLREVRKSYKNRAA